MIEVFFDGGKHTCISKIYAYDYGQQLRIWGLHLPSVVEVHFNRHGCNEPVLRTGICTEGVTVVPVPDSMLERPGSFECIVFFRGNSAGESEYMMRFEVLKRSTLPAATVNPSGDDITYFAGVIAQMEDLLAQARTAAQEAIDNMEVDAVPIVGSDNLAKSGGIYGAIDEKVDRSEFSQFVRQVEIRTGDALGRVVSLDETELVHSILEAQGEPAYVDDNALQDYSDYGLTSSGWYVFARIYAKDPDVVTGETEVQGDDGHIMQEGNNYIDVAVRFDVAAASKKVTINWGDSTETFTFKATDLAVRNLDYRSTFYLYDIAPFVTWSYARTTDTTFTATKRYYTRSGDVYSRAEVTANAAVPASYYEQTVSYSLTADTEFQDGKTYYAESDGDYIAAEVTAGDAVTAETYYEQTVSYDLTTDTEIQAGKTYYTLANNIYSAAEVNVGDPVLVYYVHSKLTISGLTRNLTYVLNEMVDCPTEIVLPDIPDGDRYGAWFDIQFYHDNTYSITANIPEGVKIATNNTPSPSKGMNLIHYYYTFIDGVKVWGAMNTHVDFTA